MTQNVQAKTSRTINVNEQPPATHFTTKYTAKHNALFATGWEPKMQGLTKKYYPTKEVWRFFEAGEANP